MLKTIPALSPRSNGRPHDQAGRALGLLVLAAVPAARLGHPRPGDQECRGGSLGARQHPPHAPAPRTPPVPTPRASPPRGARAQGPARLVMAVVLVAVVLSISCGSPARSTSRARGVVRSFGGDPGAVPGVRSTAPWWSPGCGAPPPGADRSGPVRGGCPLQAKATRNPLRRSGNSGAHGRRRVRGGDRRRAVRTVGCGEPAVAGRAGLGVAMIWRWAAHCRPRRGASRDAGPHGCGRVRGADRAPRARSC
ncbi:hypothetical protein QJS66_01590 [Kocuria rhizophila]|nr:hypothetical protein QJS66_01590 [Kocuria rhizophila]